MNYDADAALDDEQLVQLAQSGSREAFQLLYQRYLARVYNRVRSKVPPGDVEDVTQEIFIALVRSLNSYEQRSRFSTWLYTIVNRQIADFYRRRSRGPAEPPIELDDPYQTFELGSTLEGEQSDQRLLLGAAMRQLPEHYQDIIVSRFSDGLTFAEIAQARGQTLEAVKSLYRRAIQAVRDGIGEGINGSQ